MPAESGKGYDFREIEAKWQRHWQQHKTFRTPDLAELDTSKPKFYALDMWAAHESCKRARRGWARA